jgi:hypothetical protein
MYRAPTILYKSIRTNFHKVVDSLRNVLYNIAIGSAPNSYKTLTQPNKLGN